MDCTDKVHRRSGNCASLVEYNLLLSLNNRQKLLSNYNQLLLDRIIFLLLHICNFSARHRYPQFFVRNGLFRRNRPL
jgi:hypothetical protein